MSNVKSFWGYTISTKYLEVEKLIQVSNTATFKENAITMHFVSLQVSIDNSVWCHHCAFHFIFTSSLHRSHPGKLIFFPQRCHNQRSLIRKTTVWKNQNGILEKSVVKCILQNVLQHCDNHNSILKKCGNIFWCYTLRVKLVAQFLCTHPALIVFSISALVSCTCIAPNSFSRQKIIPLIEKEDKEEGEEGEKMEEEKNPTSVSGTTKIMIKCWFLSNLVYLSSQIYDVHDVLGPRLSFKIPIKVLVKIKVNHKLLQISQNYDSRHYYFLTIPEIL